MRIMAQATPDATLLRIKDPMGEIETTYDLPGNLTIIKAVGKMEPGDFREWTASYYTGPVTLHTLWDLTQADLSQIQAADLRDDAAHTKLLADVRKGGKTAIVSANTLAYGMSRMLEAFYELEEIPFDVQVFHSLEEARAWLDA